MNALKCPRVSCDLEQDHDGECGFRGDNLKLHTITQNIIQEILYRLTQIARPRNTKESILVALNLVIQIAEQAIQIIQTDYEGMVIVNKARCATAIKEAAAHHSRKWNEHAEKGYGHA